ncbi:STAS domain-containing protein [Streptomyces sp. NPDC050535]|uniref:STAS domain-containing protein n=1 Tax=Streptomyces sp. NPDC050535 TaxID=3365626 RepID=UPI0037921F58
MLEDLLPAPSRVPPLRGTQAPYGAARTRLVHGFTVVEFCGDIDIAAIPGMRARVDAVTQPAGARVIVDLRPATFLDASALAPICRAHRQTLGQGGHMGVICTCPWQRRILQATDLHTLLQPATTLEGALATALRGPHR